MLCLTAHPLPPPSSSPPYTCLRSRPLCSATSVPLTTSSSVALSLRSRSGRRGCTADWSRRATTMAAFISPVAVGGGLVQDLVPSAVTAGVAHGLFRFFQGLADRDVCDLKLNRKLMHITFGMVPLLFWPLFSSGRYAPFLAALAPGINIVRTLLLGLGIRKNKAILKSLSRSGDHREFLKAPLYYVIAIALATSVLWRTSPIAIAIICNLCVGDGVADIVGRRLGKEKLPYNPKKSYAGSIAMDVAGFLASVGCMHYFHTFGFIEESWYMILGFLVVSVAATLVESHPISTKVDDNLTVPLASFLVGSLIL